MKKTIEATLFFVLIAVTCYGQYSQNDLNKYWNYRQRYIHSFVSIGSNPGQSIPFNNRNINRWNGSFTGTEYIAGGESTISLGQYIALLATEYKLLNINNQDVNNTIKELYYALYAFNRLDLLGETVNTYSKLAKLDGFFVREDFPDNFDLNPINTNASNPNQNIYYEVGKGTPYIVNHTEYEGLLTCAPDDHYYSKYNHTPMSTDHFVGMIFGLTIANKCLDEGVTYLNTPFQDGEVFILKEVKNIMDRLLTKAENDLWELKEPDGIHVGNCENNAKTNLADNNGHLTQYSIYLAKIGFDVTGNIYIPAGVSLPVANVPAGGIGALGLLSNRTYNVNMTLKMLTLSDNDKSLVLKRSERYNWKPYYLLIGNLLNNWKLKESNKKCIEKMISSAPCDGPFYHSKDDYAKDGWASDDRFSNNLYIQNLGGPESNTLPNAGNYSGIDYMLLHNLYRLAVINDISLPKYTINLSTHLDCDDSNTNLCKIKNCKCKVRKECRQSCRDIKKACKKDCKNSCSNVCQGKKGLKKLWCKLSCKWVCKQKCRKAYRECKKECKEQLMKICE